MPAAGKASTKGRHENKKRKIVSLFFPPNEMLRVKRSATLKKWNVSRRPAVDSTNHSPPGLVSINGSDRCS
jgi:hypothetical protein